jgi:membrane protein DedA with SNARE-associated domain
VGGLGEAVGVLGAEIVAFIHALGAWGIAICMAIESCNIPLPSEIILPYGGYLASTGRITYLEASLAGAVGGTAGSIASYFLGLHGGRHFLLRYGRYLGFNRTAMARADRWFARYGDWAVFLSRLLPAIRTFISLPAGIARMHFPRFVAYTFVGSLIWSLALTWVGYLLGSNWEEVRVWMHELDLVLLGAAAGALGYWWWQRRQRRSAR